ncbi:16630_t:CDS:2 [Gigaspora rosea]|nr:16630_t:CDS:2 [Gigaspora rosea]
MSKTERQRFLSNFDSLFSTAEKENQQLIDQLQETSSNSEKGKECEKVTRTLDVEYDLIDKRQQPEAEICIQSLKKLNNDQLHTIGEIVRPKGTYGAILELQKFLENKKEQKHQNLMIYLKIKKILIKIIWRSQRDFITDSQRSYKSDIAFIFDLN